MLFLRLFFLFEEGDELHVRAGKVAMIAAVAGIVILLAVMAAVTA